MENQELIDLLRKLLTLQSYDPQKSEVSFFINKLLQSQGIKSEIIESNGIKNIVAKTEGTARILFNGHWDTVLPNESYKKELPIKEDSTHIYGLGACDMKSGMACMTAAFIECFKNNIPGVILCLVGDEELGGENGTNILVKKEIIAPNVVLGEPTNLALSMGQKSGFTMNVIAQGTPAHAAYPHRGDNAILKMTKFISKVNKQYRVPNKDISPKAVYTKITASPDLIQGGSATNVIPAECTVTYDVRFPPRVVRQELKDTLKQIAKDVGVELRFDYDGDGWTLDKSTQLFKVSREAMKDVTHKPVELIYKMGTNDGKYYGPKGCNIVNIGPGDNKLSHTVNEKVSKEELHQAKNIYLRIATNISG